MRTRLSENHSSSFAAWSRSLRPRLKIAPLALTATCILMPLFASTALAQFSTPGMRQEERQRPRRSEPQQPTPSFEEDETNDDEDEESESEPGVQSVSAVDPASVLRAARVIYVNSNTDFVNQQEVEDSLRKRKEFRAWGLVLTRNMEEADLHIEITRKALTRRFTFSVIDPRTMTIVTSGKTRSVVFGKKIANKIAEKFVNRMKTVRPYPPVGP